MFTCKTIDCEKPVFAEELCYWCFMHKIPPKEVQGGISSQPNKCATPRCGKMVKKGKYCAACLRNRSDIKK